MPALIFTKATDYVHECIGPAASRCEAVLRELGHDCVISADASPHFDTLEALLKFDLVAFISNSGELFDDKQKEVFRAYVEEHKRPVFGSHAATAAFLNGEDATGATVMSTTWPFYAEMWGSSFTDHPPIQDGKVIVSDESSTDICLNLPQSYETNDEWYNFDRNVFDNANITVLARADPQTFQGGKMGEQHPLIWKHDFKGARVFYTALGHHPAAYDSDPSVINVLTAGLTWCLKA
eukprot:m.58679 g.58679  ORF g.58679 m.58679 type:complete len:237 (-) comp13166_c1_seq1:105-815(-)